MFSTAPCAGEVWGDDQTTVLTVYGKGRLCLAPGAVPRVRRDESQQAQQGVCRGEGCRGDLYIPWTTSKAARLSRWEGCVARGLPLAPSLSVVRREEVNSRMPSQLEDCIASPRYHTYLA
jgi:hypothetical protein